MRHYLEPTGGIPDLPVPARRMADFMGTIVSVITSMPWGEQIETDIVCSVDSEQGPCTGPIFGVLELE